MQYKFCVHLTDKDYLDYNVFWSLKSPYGKKQILQLRAMIAGMFALLSLLVLFKEDFSSAGFIKIIPLVVLLVLSQLLLNWSFSRSLKGTLKTMKRQGKMGYSPDSEMEFFEDRFVETTPEEKTERIYSSIERISVIGDKTIYIHMNNVSACILPRSCFDSKENYEEFLQFIKTKCQKVDIY